MPRKAATTTDERTARRKPRHDDADGENEHRLPEVGTNEQNRWDTNHGKIIQEMHPLLSELLEPWHGSTGASNLIGSLSQEKYYSFLKYVLGEDPTTTSGS